MNPILFVEDITEYEDEERFGEAYAGLPESRRIKIDSFRIKSAGLQSLGAGVALSRALRSIGANLFDDEWEICEGEFGKPHFVHHPEVHFSLSHSGTYAVCVLDNFEIGCDIEKISRGRVSRESGREKVAGRFFTKAEQDYIGQFADADKKLSAFFDIWTRKESFIKAVGAGLSIPLQSFSVVTPDGKLAETVNVAPNDTLNEIIKPPVKANMANTVGEDLRGRYSICSKSDIDIDIFICKGDACNHVKHGQNFLPDYSLALCRAVEGIC